ncbi:chaperone protein dnaJ 8, chloroplastic-like [Typha angustifolia]|uniref:chaperone protein dnaJ 8, chloroplastic-like n=1 Tax=Typha angustifolia TaxID=59011 RepID=UPI003C2D78A7
MAMSMGLVGSVGLDGRRWRRKAAERGAGVRCSAAAAGSLTDQYRMLRIQPGATEKEVKKAFRQLALQYHPDVCKGSNCGVQFHRINDAYDTIMDRLRQAEDDAGEQWQSQEWSAAAGDDYDEQMRGMYDPAWDLWEEWMGWEGAGIRDYSSHVNPYI